MHYWSDGRHVVTMVCSVKRLEIAHADGAQIATFGYSEQ